MMFVARTGIVFLLAALSISPAFSQERTLSNDVARVLRVWPASGRWQVILLRNEKHKLMCILGTGKLSPAKITLYMYGLAEKDNSLSLIIVDQNKSALSGHNIASVIDGVSIGSYPITYWNQNPISASYVIESKLSNQQGRRIENLLAFGSTIKLITNGATYQSSLDGIRGELHNFKNCIREVKDLQGDTK